MKEINWACEPTFLRSYIDQVLEHHGKEIEEFKSEFESQRKKSKTYSISSKKEGFINITGVLSRTGPSPIEEFFGIGGTAYNDIIEAAQELKVSNVDTVRLIMDTPGGEVTGADETYLAIKSLAETKTVVAENHGMLASAGYWIASAADQIVSTSPVNQTGSIGVLATLVDTSEAEKEAGIKRTQIVSTNAPNKVEGSDEAGIASIRERLDAIERVFVSRVAEGRGVSEKTVTSQFGRGGLMIAQDPNDKAKDAISVGMIDGLISASISAACGGRNGRKRAEVMHGEETAQTIEQNEKAQIERTEKMKLEDVLAEHPEILGEIDALKNAAHKAGKSEACARNEAIVKVLAGEDYPKSVKNVGFKVLTGESEFSHFESAMVVYDALVEEKVITKAEQDSKEIGDIQPQVTEPASQDGIIRNEEDLALAQAQIKQDLGIN